MNSIRCLLTSHDVDIRYQDPDVRHRVSNLYLPLIAIIIDNLEKLFSWSTEGESRIVGSNPQNEHINMILNVISDNIPAARGKVIFKETTTKHLLICFLWVLKNVDKAILKQWWIDLPVNRLQILLEVLRITLSCFQYKVTFQVYSLKQYSKQIMLNDKKRGANEIFTEPQGLSVNLAYGSACLAAPVTTWDSPLKAIQTYQMFWIRYYPKHQA